MKVPNEPGLSPNNGLENVSLSDQSTASNPRKGQAKCPGAKTTSHDGRAGHVMTHMCHPSKERRMASVTIQVPTQGICTPATGMARENVRDEKQASKAERTSPKWAHHYAEPNSTSKKHPPMHAAHHRDQDQCGSVPTVSYGLCSWHPWGWQGPPATEGGLTGPPR